MHAGTNDPVSGHPPWAPKLSSPEPSWPRGKGVSCPLPGLWAFGDFDSTKAALSELSSSAFLYPSLEVASCARPPLASQSFQDWSLWYCGGSPRTLAFGRRTREEGQSSEGFHFTPASALPAAITLRLRGRKMPSPPFPRPSPSHRGRTAQLWAVCGPAAVLYEGDCPARGGVAGPPRA